MRFTISFKGTYFAQRRDCTTSRFITDRRLWLLGLSYGQLFPDLLYSFFSTLDQHLLLYLSS